MSGLLLVTATALTLPALAFALWPLRGGGAAAAGLLALPPDAQEPLLERRRAALRTLRELDFEHEAGHVSDEDHAELRARYEGELAAVLVELDQLGPAAASPVVPAAPAETATGPRSAWRHPVALAVGAVGLVTFGVVLGVGVVRYTEPDPMAGQPLTGSRPLAGLPAPGDPPRPLAPGMLQGMLQAARASLEAGRYSEAIAAYQAVLKREPQNVDALAHLGLIVAIGGHAEAALETLDRALAIDPDYAPALLYRGQVLYEAKQDVAGALQMWERLRTLMPAGPERERVERMIAEAKARPDRR